MQLLEDLGQPGALLFEGQRVQLILRAEQVSGHRVLALRDRAQRCAVQARVCGHADCPTGPPATPIGRQCTGSTRPGVAALSTHLLWQAASASARSWHAVHTGGRIATAALSHAGSDLLHGMQLHQNHHRCPAAEHARVVRCPAAATERAAPHAVSSPVRAPHSGYHFDGRSGRFFEGW